MKCSRCGRKNKSGAVVCRNCGAALIPPVSSDDAGSVSRSQPQNNEVILISDGSASGAQGAAYSYTSASRLEGLKDKLKLKKPTGNAKWVLLALAGAAVIALAIIIIAAASSLGLYLPGGNSYTVLESEDGISVLYKGKEALPHVDKALVSCSADASSVGVIDTDGMLYSCRGGKTFTVDSKAAKLKVSDNGKVILYTSEGDGMLWMYNCGKNDTPRCVCSEGVSPDFAVSCDGKWVIYNKLGGDGLYLCGTGGGAKEQKIGEGLVPVSVSNGAKYIFAYSEEECSLNRVNKNGKSAPEYIRGDIGSVLWVNYDHSELAFTTKAANGNVKTMVVKGGKTYEVASGALAPVLTASMRPTELTSEGFSVVTCPMKSFDKKLFAGDGIYSFGFKGTSPVFTSDSKKNTRTSAVEADEAAAEEEAAAAEAALVTHAVMSDDMKHLYFVFGGGLYHSIKNDFSLCEKLFDGCADLKCSGNGAVVWFLNGDGALYCLAGGKAEMVSNSVTDYAISPNGKEAIFVQNGYAYWCKSSSPGNAKDLECKAAAVGYDKRGMYFFDGNAWQGINSKGKLISLTDE